MGKIVQLRQREAIAVDSSHIAAMFRHMGAVQAEMAIITTMEHLTARLRKIESSISAGTLDQVPSDLHAAREHAEEIGLISLAAILDQLETACQQQDTTAAHALWHRATRVGDSSFVDLWQLPLLQM
ncbi:hypothetical protein [Roseinatronobacter alkalisoli]|uniref:Hpt domain-containing protein n=1 Tax=Roseinatronobacter alkalisoli TaxID=3028235 RepID=A0ABT5T8Y8_9RHOB|nr:hypothetical protein [Roseinatronobacter sp. HJB301]MDD7971587.1 hypothetical protein [Roseinatronobacter sp. HJB301]